MKFERCSRENRGAAGALARGMNRSPSKEQPRFKTWGCPSSFLSPFILTLPPFRFPRTTQRLMTYDARQKSFNVFNVYIAKASMSERAESDVPFYTQQVISETILSRQSTALILTAKSIQLMENTHKTCKT